MIFWLKEKDGKVKRYEQVYSPAVYVASDNKYELELLLGFNQITQYTKEYEFQSKFEYPYHSNQKRKEVLKLTVNDSSQIINLAKTIEKICKRFGQYRLYN